MSYLEIKFTLKHSLNSSHITQYRKKESSSLKKSEKTKSFCIEKKNKDERGTLDKGQDKRRRDGEKIEGFFRFVVTQKAFTRIMTTKWVQFRTPHNKHNSMFLAFSTNIQQLSCSLQRTTKFSWTT